MHYLTDHHYPIAWFIRQGLENAFLQKEGQPAQSTWLNQELTKFTLKLPAFLYNAGYTSSIIPPGNIHIKQQGRILDISIDDVGQFSYDIRANKVHALLTIRGNRTEQVIPEIKARSQKHKQLVTKAPARHETSKAFSIMEKDIYHL
jgi:hypothetical protein